MSRKPHEYNYLHGKIVLIYSYPYDNKHLYCSFGHTYPHLHFIVEARDGRRYLVCGATGKAIMLDNIMDDIRFMIEAGIIKLSDIVEWVNSISELEEAKKIIEEKLEYTRKQ